MSGGFFVTCDDAVCTDAVTRTPFRSGQCLANPAQYGSRSVIFHCGAGSVPPSLVFNALNGFDASYGPAPAAGLRGGSSDGSAAVVGMATAILGIAAAAVIIAR